LYGYVNVIAENFVKYVPMILEKAIRNHVVVLKKIAQLKEIQNTECPVCPLLIVGLV
jgi:hypothetical protein